jgi:hypothetical protein
MLGPAEPGSIHRRYLIAVMPRQFIISPRCYPGQHLDSVASMKTKELNGGREVGKPTMSRQHGPKLQFQFCQDNIDIWEIFNSHYLPRLQWEMLRETKRSRQLSYSAVVVGKARSTECEQIAQVSPEAFPVPGAGPVGSLRTRLFNSLQRGLQPREQKAAYRGELGRNQRKDRKRSRRGKVEEKVAIEFAGSGFSDA